MFKIPKPEYSPGFRVLEVTRVKSGLTVGAIVKELGLIEQTLSSCVKVAERGKLNPPGGKAVTTARTSLF